MSPYTCEACGEALDGACECAFEPEPACEADAHAWTSEGMGGCDENPGVWSLGGTALVFKDRCDHCGAVRTTLRRGTQRNPHESDTRGYEGP